MKLLLGDLGAFYQNCKKQDLGFYIAALYLVFSYLRPQMIFRELDILPWTQITIIFGLIYLAINSRIKFQSIHISGIAFFTVVLASSFNSLYQDLSMSKLSASYIWVIEMLFFTNIIRNREQFRLSIILFFLILFKMSFFGARTWLERGLGFREWGIAGPPGFFANSGEFSLLMAMLATMSIAFLSAQKEKPKKIYYLLPITAIMTVLGASSRGGQLALLAGLLIIALSIWKIRFKPIAGIALAVCITFFVLPEEQMERFKSMGSDSTSTSRLLYWKKGLEMMQDYPFLGVGYYSFPKYFSNKYNHLKEQGSYLSSREEVAHNSFIQIGSTMGYTGLVVFLWLHLLCYLQNRKVRKLLTQGNWLYRFSYGLDASLVTYTIGSIFMSVAFYPYIYFLLMFSQIGLNIAKKESLK